MAGKEPGTQTIEENPVPQTGRPTKTKRGGAWTPGRVGSRGGAGSRGGPWAWHQTCTTPTQLYLLLAATSVVVYVNGLTGEYVHDDVSAVVRNPDVQGSRPLWQVFLNDFWGKPMADPASHKSYRPLTILTFRYVTQDLVPWCHILMCRGL